jgi:cytochrome c peroxidase
MTSNTFNNTGLDSVPTGGNLGRYLYTHNEYDKGKFSAPTLRNVELTAPYMHDGRFKTLEEVVEFYNSGVRVNSPNIDPLMTKPAKKYGLGLTTTQKANLVKFLKTLTDTSFINNPDFQSPF